MNKLLRYAEAPDGQQFQVLDQSGVVDDAATRAAYDAYYAANKTALDAIVAARDAGDVTDVERLAQGVTLYRAANEAAKEIILTLMVNVSGAMINLEVVNAASEPITADNVNDEGARFVAYHREAIVDYKQAGRNQVAANALYAAVSSEGSLTAFPWLEASGGIILGIFASELGVTP